MEDINKITLKLLTLSVRIVGEFDILTDLSAADMENTDEFLEHVNKLNDYLDSESDIVNKMDISMADHIMLFLETFMEDTDAYFRCYDIVAERFDKLSEDKRDMDNEDILEDDNLGPIFGDSIDEFLSNIISSEDIFRDDSDVYEYFDKVNNYVCITILKKFYERISQTKVTNKNDEKYKKELLKQYRSFKFFVFQLSRNLEVIGAKCAFDLNKIDMVNPFDTDLSAICYNQCATVIEKLYSTDVNERDPFTVSEVLFYIMNLEEYMPYLDDNDIKGLINLCRIYDDGKHGTYGVFGLKKLLTKK